MTPFLESHKYDWRIDNSGCYIWMGATAGTNGRRPSARDPKDNKRRSVARIVCGEANGPPSEGDEARHKCKTGMCIRDDHLQWGTHGQNIADNMS
jgi:hypothetical protein